jgi:hypothetical protein
VTTLPLLTFCFGCLYQPNPDDGTDEVPTLDQNNNNSLDTAAALTLDRTGELRFTGSIDGATDIDMYGLGTLSPGDELFVDVQTISGNLDPVAAIFDRREDLVVFNDDRTPDGSNLNPQIDIVICGEQGPYYLGIIGYPGTGTAGQYEVVVQVQRGVGVPDPEPQIVFLNWRGGNNVGIPNVGIYDLPPFSATDVGLPANQTAALKDRVQQIVEERYARFNLIVLNSDDDAEPSEPHSTVYFGGADFQAFAISEQIDTFNQDPSDKAIIFTRGFQGAFLVTPTFEQMAQALGNTVAHEVGHLMGLVHTADCNDLMDTSCSNDRILSPQAFSTAPLDDSVWPFGYQPATEILGWILGLVGL